jgi:peptidyl-tRNA hydrolase, PTH1 family
MTIPTAIKLFVGLGNPGPEYEATRHNAGFWWIDALARDLKTHLVAERAYQGLVARVNGGPAGPVWLLEPMTFMNRSGVAVAALARFFKIEPAQILVVHDELDLQPGQAKMKFGGSAAGHNGLKDIHGQLGTQDFWRLRLGIGHPGVKAEVVNYVLKKPSAEHREAIDKVSEQALGAVQMLIAGDMEKALARVHAGAQREHKPKPPKPVAAAVQAAPVAQPNAPTVAVPGPSPAAAYAVAPSSNTNPAGGKPTP